MILSDEYRKENVYRILEEAFLTASVDYVHRVLLIQNENVRAVADFLKQIDDELRQMCYIRRFTIFNTNVIKNVQTRVLSDDTIRAFYFELYRAICTSIALEYSKDDKDTMFRALRSANTEVPCRFVNGTVTALSDTSQEFSNLCGTMFIEESMVNDFFIANPWYIVAVLANMHAPTLIERLSVLINSISQPT